METKKAYGLVTAVGTKLGERARADRALDQRLRDAPDLDAFVTRLREASEGIVPPAVLAAFLDDVLTPEDWVQWRARLLLQLKMVRDGGKPAAGHEAGKGVGRP